MSCRHDPKYFGPCRALGRAKRSTLVFMSCRHDPKYFGPCRALGRAKRSCRSPPKNGTARVPALVVGGSQVTQHLTVGLNERRRSSSVPCSRACARLFVVPGHGQYGASGGCQEERRPRRSGRYLLKSRPGIGSLIAVGSSTCGPDRAGRGLGRRCQAAVTSVMAKAGSPGQSGARTSGARNVVAASIVNSPRGSRDLAWPWDTVWGRRLVPPRRRRAISGFLLLLVNSMATVGSKWTVGQRAPPAL